MTHEELVAVAVGRVVGRVTRTRETNRLAFAYDEAWRATEGAFPVSLSMPLASAAHAHKAVEAFLWGLLPDNENVLDRWAKQFHVSARNPFGLLANVGEDCAGAVQFARPERLDELVGGGRAEVAWLTERGVGSRLRLLREDHAAWRIPSDSGQFSLAGAQPKTALLLKDGRWGVPSGRTPTTHILKPPTAAFDGHAENEHFCLALAQALGLPAAGSEVRRFDGEVAIVVERYDRVRVGREFVRVHQEDLCQALAFLPTAKYQADGGPGPARIVELLRTSSSRPAEDVATFIDALAFNWLVAGTDGHAKNYSLLHGAGGRVRLAPLYDLASALPYPDMPEQKLKLAMKVGDSYRLRDVLRRNWERFAEEVRLPPAQVVERVASLASRLPKKVAAVRAQAAEEGLDHPILDRLAKVLPERARRCVRLLGS